MNKARIRALVGILGVMALGTALASCRRDGGTFDLVVKGGRIVDGSGNPWYKGDVGIRDGRIAAVAPDIDERAAAGVLRAEGLVVAPGFIDIHTHADRGLVETPSADNYISQGVTTVIGGNCGDHEYPLEKFYSEIARGGISLNLGMLAGHNTIRNAVMGFKMAPPSREDMDRMKALLEGEMRAGALGLSTGLAYLPGVYSGTEEIVELASAVAPYGGLYASHIRNQGEKITEAVEEAIAVGEANGIPVEVSHIKLAEEAVWNDPGRVTRPVEEARARGVEVYLDQYPYTATSSGFTSSFPQDVFEGGRDKFLQRMTDPSTRRRARDWIIGRRLRSERGIDKLKAIYVASCRQNPEYEGKNLEQILALKGLAPSPGNGADLIISIVESGDASAVFFQMDEADVATLMRLPYLMIGSDGAIQVAGKGFPHPRSYGTFTRVLGRYAREEGVLGLADAVRKMTSLPAQVLRLEGRGAVKKGMWADITVFDPATVIDTATFEAPHQYSRGVVAVLVNGVTVYSDGRWTGRLPGKILKGRGRSS